jgi:hypothetical protein
MKRLLLLTTGVSLILLALSFVVIGRGRAGPMREVVEGLGWCEGKPCFMGIVPGQTSWDEARSILIRHGGVETDIGIALSIGSSAKILVWSRLEDFDKSVTVIEIHLPEGSPSTLGSLISYYGSPCAVTQPYNLNVPSFVLLYKSMSFYATSPYSSQQDYTSLDPSWPVYTVQLFDLEHGCEGTSYTSSWRGFASLRAYPPKIIGK